MRLGRTTRVLAVQLAVVLFIGVLGTVAPHQDAVLRVGSQLMAIPIVVVAFRLAATRVPGPLDAPIVLGLVAYLIVAVASADRTGSIHTAGLAGAWALLFVVMAYVAQRPRIQRTVAAAVASTIAAWLLIMAVTWIGEKVTWVSLGGGLPNLAESKQSGFWLTVNAIPVLALLGTPFLAFLSPGRARRTLAGLFITGALITIPLSGGRAAWVGIAAGLLLMGVLLGPEWLLRIGRRRAVRVGGVVGVALVGLAAAVFADRLFSLSGLSARLPLWQQAFGIVRDDPLTGGGPGTYAWLRLVQADDYASRVPAILAHNVPIQTLADGGMLLFGAFGLIVGAFAYGAWRARRTLSVPARCALAALGGMGVTSLLDDHSSLPGLTAMTVALAAWVVAELPPPTGRASRLPGWLLPATALAVVAISLPFVVRVDLARLDAQTGRGAALAGDLDRATVHFERAAGWYPDNALYRLQAGMSRALAGDTLAATEHYRAAAALSPGDPRPLGGLADLTSSERERIGLLDRASRLTGDDPRYSYRLGMELLAQDDTEAAVDALARATAVDATVLKAVERDAGVEIGAAVATRAATVGADLAGVLRRDPAELRDNLAIYAGERPESTTHRAIGAWSDGRHELARDLLAEAQLASPFVASTWEAAAYVARDECDADAYRRAMLLRFWSPGGASARRPDDMLVTSQDLAYREVGLGRYQPGDADRAPVILGWPYGLIGPVADCSGWDLEALSDPFRE